jgi:lipopolysaccharide/colanic/teichoic acid biosynthesis glycosyltransferase
MSQPFNKTSDSIKYGIDFFAGLIGLIVLLPLLLVIAILVRVGSPGPVFYRGLRVGQFGVPFRMFKFRTMVVNAEALGGSATPQDDPRITGVGRLLRRYKLDELPQLLNLVRGEMSLVGPRPEVQKYAGMYAEEEKLILQLRPGITDWASIWNSNEAAVLDGSKDPEKAYEELIRPTKVALQLFYFRNRSLLTDCKIAFHTLCRLVWENWTPRELMPFGKVRRYKVTSQVPSP